MISGNEAYELENDKRTENLHEHEVDFNQDPYCDDEGNDEPEMSAEEQQMYDYLWARLVDCIPEAEKNVLGKS